MIGFYPINFNVAAVRKACIPKGIDISKAYFWTKGNNAYRCMANFKDNPDLIAKFIADIQYIANRYKDEPLVESINFKGESTFGFGGNADLPPGISAGTELEELKDHFYATIRQGLGAWNDTAPNKFGTQGINNMGTQDPAEIASRIQLFTDFFDARGSMGWQLPDPMNNPGDVFPPHPGSHFFRQAHSWRVTNTVPRQNRYPVVGETQRQKVICKLSVRDCWAVLNEPVFTYEGLGVSADFYKPSEFVNYPSLGDTYQGGANTHTVWLGSAANSYTWDEIIAMLDSVNWEVYSTACPKAFDDKGYTCVTGET